MEELAECLSDPDGESTLEALAIRDCLERFLRTLSEEDRTGYFACFSNAEIGEKCGFILFADGTWGEYEIHDGCFEGCHGDGCPAGSEDDYPHALTKGCRITLADGRIFELVEQEIDGSMMYVPVPISELTA